MKREAGTYRHVFVICAYRESRYLEECIRSLLDQTVKSTIIMVTSTPNESISRASEKYQIPLYVNAGQHGIAEDWNFGYRKASELGSYVTIAHQDDVYEPGYTEAALRGLKRNRDGLIFFCGYSELRAAGLTEGKNSSSLSDDKVKAASVRLNESWVKVTSSRLLNVKKGMLLPLRVLAFQRSRWIRRRILSFGNPICCPSVTYNVKRLPETIFRPEYKSNIDWLAWEELSKKRGAFVYDPRPLMSHRIHEGSTTTELIEGDSRWREDYAMFRRFWPKWAADILIRFYRKSEKSNRLEKD